MSVKIMGIVWDSDLPREEKFILLAYADHADHNGRNIFPSYGRIAWKTGYTRRHVMRVVEDLERKGIMVKIKQGDGPNGTNLWAIVVDRLPQRSDYGAESGQDQPSSGDTVTPPSDTMSPPPGDIVSPPVSECHPPSDILTPGGDISDKNLFKMSPESSFNRPLNPSINHQGGGEVDILISGSKFTPSHAWEVVAGQLQREVARQFLEYIRDLEVVGYDHNRSIFFIRAPTEYAREWVESRLASTIRRYLTGVCNRSVEIKFVFPTAGD